MTTRDARFQPAYRRRMNRLLAALVGGTAAMALAASPAYADGILSVSEARYVDQYAAPVICVHLDYNPSLAGVTDVIIAVLADGWSLDSTADIINNSVWLYCPRHSWLLDAYGAAATPTQPTLDRAI